MSFSLSVLSHKLFQVEFLFRISCNSAADETRVTVLADKAKTEKHVISIDLVGFVPGRGVGRSREHVENAILPSGTRQKDTRSPLQMSSFAHIKSGRQTRAHTHTHARTHTHVIPVYAGWWYRRGPIVPWREQTRRHVCRRSATLYSLFRSKGEGPKDLSRRLASTHSYAYLRGPDV